MASTAQAVPGQFQLTFDYTPRARVHRVLSNIGIMAVWIPDGAQTFFGWKLVILESIRVMPVAHIPLTRKCLKCHYRTGCRECFAACVVFLFSFFSF